ncbi:hypothetical protein B0H14DRAFT_2346531, partial [Mycena olivaceomarginata]
QVGNQGRALQNACARKHEAVVRLLVEMGADVNVSGGRFRSPPEAASDSGHEPIVRFLGEKGADVDPQGEHFQLALNAASLRATRKWFTF